MKGCSEPRFDLPALPFIRIHPNDLQATPLGVILDAVHLIACGILLVLRGHADILCRRNRLGLGFVVILGLRFVVIAVFAYSKLQGQIDLSVPKAGGKVVLMAAKQLVPFPVGVLLLGAACAVVLSTGMNYLLSSSSNVIRDIYQRMVRPDADPTKMVALQKVFIVVMGFCAFLMIFVPTYLKSQISILQYAYFAYTMYGVAVTPALFASVAATVRTNFFALPAAPAAK